MAKVLELTLKGPIGPGGSISESLIRGRIEAATGSFNAIHFTIDSTGGDVEESFAILTMLLALPFPIAATAIGECFSGALLLFMAAGLRKAKTGTKFLLHPASRGRDQLPERVTAECLQRQADELAKVDEREVDLFSDRTGFAREFFESEQRTEETLDTALVIETGLVHEFDGLTPPCDPAWPENVKRIEKETGCIFPSWAKTPSYAEACRCAAFFEQGRNDAHGRHLPAPAIQSPRLSVVAG